jgi:hypothetical protein
MQRFANGNRINGMDMSPAEREWVEHLKKWSQAVLDYQAEPRDTLEKIHTDIDLIVASDLDLDAAIQQGRRPRLRAEDFTKPSRQLWKDDHRFWGGLVAVCDAVLNGKSDFLDLFSAVCHDVSFLSGDDYYLARSIARRFWPKVCRS